MFQTAQILGLSLLSSGLANFMTPDIVVAQVCNSFGCSAPGASSCNAFGCSAPGASPCNAFGCPAPGAGPCGAFGCPSPPTVNTNPNPSASSPQTNRSFQIINNTGVELYYFYASPAGQNSWSNDVLGNSTLPNGQAWSLRLIRGCQYDFQAQTEDGYAMTWYNINVCGRNSIVLNP
jgi:hypothetical protein